MCMYICLHMYTYAHKAMEKKKVGQRLVHRRGLEFHTVEIILPFIYLINIRRKMGRISISLRINPVKLKCQRESYK